MTDKCSDSLDLAAQRQAEANEQALERQRQAERARRLATQQALDDGEFDGVHCVTCDVELPAQRVIDGRMLCTACQTKEETRIKMRGGK